MTDFYLSLYPAYRSYQSVKKPRVKELEHWIVFWQVFWALYFFDCVIYKTSGLWSWIPLSQLVWNFYSLSRFTFILANYHPNVTYFTHKTLFKFCQQETQKCWKQIKNGDVFNMSFHDTIMKYTISTIDIVNQIKIKITNNLNIIH